MALTIDLPPEADRMLREKAAREGRDAEAVAAAVLAGALEWERRETADAIAGIQRGLDDFEEGRYRGFAEFAAEQRRKYRLPRDG